MQSGTRKAKGAVPALSASASGATARRGIPRRAVAPDADADSAGTAPFALRVPDCMQNALPDTLQGAVRAAEMRQLDRQRVLGVGVLAAAPLEDQLHFDLVALPLVEVHDGCPRSE